MVKSKRILAAVLTTLLVMAYLGSLTPYLPGAQAQQQDENKGGRNWVAVDYDRMATQFNPQNQINKQNVQLLELKWIFPFPSALDIGGYTLSSQHGSLATPLVVDGIIYLASNFGRVFGLDASKGKILWTYIPELNYTRDIARGVIIGAGAGAGALGTGHTHGISYFDGKLYVPEAPCDVHVLDALTGRKVAQISDMCVNIPGRDQIPYEEQKKRGFNLAFSGNYKGAQSYGPAIMAKERVLIVPAGPVDESNKGARGFFAGYDMDNYRLLWRFFLTPPHGGDPEWTVRVADKGWIQGVRASTLPREILLNDWGQARGVQTGPGWGQYAFDEETGIVYVGTTQPAPDWNATYRPGPNVFSDSIIALKARTGELVWWHQTTTHDLWDWDCAWSTSFAKIDFGAPTGVKKAVFKGCKNGIVYMLDAATGAIIWTWNAPSVARCEHCPIFTQQAQQGFKPDWNSGAATKLKSTRDGHNLAAWDPKDPDIYKLRWANDPDNGPRWLNPAGTGAIEADLAFDGKTIYVGTYNSWSYGRSVPVDPWLPSNSGNQGLPAPQTRAPNATLYALDAATGRVKWSFFMDGVGFRAGNTVSGGVVYAATADGNLRGLDADTGKLLWQKFLGGGLATPPVIAADASGKMMLFQLFGSTGFVGISLSVPGGLMTFGLPDKLPESQVVTKEVIKEVVKEVVKEVPKEVIKEVPKEVVKTVTVETINPITYALVGVSVIVLVVSAVLFSRRKKA